MGLADEDDSYNSSEGSDDESVQQHLLEQLNRYGDSLLDDSGLKSKTLKSKVIKSDSGKLQNTTSRKQKKKKHKNKIGSKSQDADFDEETWGDSEPEEPLSDPRQKQIEKFKLALGLSEAEIERLKQKKIQKESIENTDSTLEPVLTDGVKIARKRPPPEIIVFEDPAKRKAKKPKIETTTSRKEQFRKEPEEGSSEEGFDLKRARWEVRRYGITGLAKQEKDEAQVQLAIQLGAVPPKKPNLNYKELMEKRRQEKQEEQDRIEMMRKMGYKVTKVDPKKKRKRDVNEVGSLEGQVGRYEVGVQKVTNRDISKINQAKKKR